MKPSNSSLSTISFRLAAITLMLAGNAGLAGAQVTHYVDDDGPGDPVPGISDPNNNAFSDPLEDGTPAHPYDDLWKAVDAAAPGDVVLVLPSNHLGSYFLSETLDLSGKAITIRSQAGPSATRLDGTSMPGQPGILASSGETSATVFEGFLLINFDRGSAVGVHGGAIDIRNSSPTIRDCWFALNHAYRGAAIHLLNSASRIEDCIFSLNTSVHQGGAVFTDSGAPTFSRCDFFRNTANYGGAITCFTSGATPVTVRDCVFRENSALVSYGGALSSHFTGSITVVRSRFISNDATGPGGAVFINQGFVRDCTFNSNTSGNSQGALCAIGSLTVHNATFFGNEGGACFEATGGNLVLRNSISWNNTPYEIGNNVSVQSCDVLGGFAGVGNIDVDPLFANPGGPDGIFGNLDDDLSLFHLSPCIDAGDTTQLAPGYPQDLLGNPRAVNFPGTDDTGTASVGHTIDMGAYEFPAPTPACTIRHVKTRLRP